MRCCPKCEEDVSDSYQGYEPDVGIMTAGWYCEACDLIIEDDRDQDQGDLFE